MSNLALFSDYNLLTIKYLQTIKSGFKLQVGKGCVFCRLSLKSDYTLNCGYVYLQQNTA